MAMELLKALSVIGLYFAVLLFGVSAVRFMDARRRAKEKDK